MSKTHYCLLASVLAIAPGARAAQTTWQGDVFATDWSTPANWSNGVPDSTRDVIIPDVPSGILEIGSDTNALSITVQPGASPFSIMAPTDALNLYGDFTNSATNGVDVSADVNFKHSMTLNGQGASITFRGVSSTVLNTVIIQGLINFVNTIVLGLDSAVAYGRFLVDSAASLDLSGVTTIAFSASPYTGANNNRFQLFDLTDGFWTGASVLSIHQNTLPTLTGGLAWDLTRFEIDGSISVVPVPSTITLLPIGAALASLVRRRNRRGTLPVAP
ncbi:PEP-CTERM sorting domain-containing protein [uncultured Thiodictyon sp.]|jgi:hypothetical protein|uniref:PEP-CTERM sorting domain-containing protein n=1 Tax=uncultured Thiodictyon sp. TaxID=1846217 RepID=UPI0025D8D310|nr:PEP-CTERM sorting domain-containing protein [uncultured Thiodictyon sp.]